jgi:hypothetical protein
VRAIIVYRFFSYLIIKKKKLGLADAALGEGTGVKLNKLSVREIKAVRVPFFLRFPLFKCYV